MKDYTCKKVHRIVICIMMALSIVCGLINVNIFNVFAEDAVTDASFTGIDGSPEEGENLYNATNTYDYSGDNTQLNITYEYYNTSAETTNGNTVSGSAPIITVLTHGLGGSASHWSNDANGNLAYDQDSLFARIDKELENAGKSGASVSQFKCE